MNLSVNGTKSFDYTGSATCAYLQKAGRYKLEAWGAQGGRGSSSKPSPGYGGYAYGTISSTANAAIYIYVGGQGLINDASNDNGGWNGGGNSKRSDARYNGGGGGATDFAAKGAIWNSSDHLYSRFLVAGGGSGASYSVTGQSGCGGGYISGAGGNSQFRAGQTYAGVYGSFGIGGDWVAENGTSYPNGGGGGGWYGGGTVQNVPLGSAGGYWLIGGGSGYIYNALSESSYPAGKLVSSAYYLTDAGMYMYNSDCTSSSATATKTTCTTSTGHAVTNAANTGNGYARITYLGT